MNNLFLPLGLLCCSALCAFSSSAPSLADPPQHANVKAASSASPSKTAAKPLSAGVTKTLLFPDYQIGKVFVLPRNANLTDKKSSEAATYIGPAKGAVVVPENASIQVKLDYFLTAAPKKLILPDGIAEVHLDGIAFEDSICEPISKSPSLVRVTISSSDITDAGVEQLAKLKHLRALSLDQTMINGSCLASLSALKELAYLDISQNKLNLANLKSLSFFTHVVRARLIACGLTDDSLKAVGQMKALYDLNLKNNKKLTDAGVKHLIPLKELSWLNVEGTAIDLEGIESLLKNMNLHSLTFSRNLITDQELARLKKRYPKTAITFSAKDMGEINSLYAPLK